MGLSVEEILRRLLVLGLPLVPLGCGQGAGAAGTDGGGGSGGGKCIDSVCVCLSQPYTPHGFDSIVTVDGLEPWVTQAAFDLCLAGDCSTLCADEARYIVGLATVTTCERVAADGGADASGAPTDAAANAGVDTNAAGDADAADAAGDASDVDVAGDASLPGSTNQPITLHIAGTTQRDCTGRRPAGLDRVYLRARGNAAGRWLARAAVLEAASVPAFRQLARELAAHGAPARLVAAARAAVRQEERHYLLVARAARARGAAPVRPRVRPVPIRPLVEVARENAREGCVRETFGAMTATFQSRHATDTELRALMASIARDEAGHARLAWEIDAWARNSLSRNDARAVDEVRRAEGAALVAEIGRAELEPAVARTLGLASASAERQHARRVQRALWNA